MAATAEGRHSRPQAEMTSQKFRTPRRAIARGAFRNASLKTERETTMKTTTKNTGIKVTASVKAGAISGNHTRGGLKVNAGIKAGYICKHNHNALSLTVA
jgi:hypothetical protein